MPDTETPKNDPDDPDAAMRFALNWLSAHRASIKTWTESLHYVAIICSLIVGALWTYDLFVKKDKPALEFHAGLDVNIEWARSKQDDKLCWGTVIAKLKNEGIKPFEVTEMLLRGWYYKLAPTNQGDPMSLRLPTSGNPTQLDSRKIMQNPPNISISFTKDNSKLPGNDILPGLLRYYPPGAENNSGRRLHFLARDRQRSLVQSRYCNARRIAICTQLVCLRWGL